jgi:hypothetical protein
MNNMPEEKKEKTGVDAALVAYRIVSLIGIKIALAIFIVVFVVTLILLITLPLSSNKELTDKLKDEVAIDYVKTGDYFDFDWQLLIIKDATLHKNDVSKVKPLDSLLEMITLTETIKTVTQKSDGTTKTRYKDYTYTGKKIFTRVQKYYEGSRDIEYTPETLGPGLLELPQKYQVISSRGNTTEYLKFSTKYLNIEEIIEKYFPDKDTAAQFRFTYESHLIADYVFVCDTESTSSANIIGSKNWGDIVLNGKETPVTYYCQTDTRWATLAYGDSTIGRAGCGPTALAIVISSLRSHVEPPTVSDWAFENGYKAKGGGSYHSLMVDGAKHWGLKVKSGVTSQAEVIKALDSGKLIIAIMGPGEFTKGGHYIVLRGVTKEGKILVADPNSYTRSNKEYDLSLIARQAKAGFWIYY